MIIRRHTNRYNFVADPKTGITFRWGETFKENPIMAPWPELADVSISNYCNNNCEYCYRNSSSEGKFIALKDFSFLLNQLTCPEYGAVFQIALGGGEPLLHPEFVDILRITREEFGMIPNYTTNGKFFNQDIIEATKKWCGAIAISYDPYRKDVSLDELRQTGIILKKENIKTNIHYVLSEKTIQHAIKILKGYYDEFFNIYNAIIFLTYKPTGRANYSDCIKGSNSLRSFLRLIEEPVSKVKTGFDACMVPLLMKHTDINRDFLDSCECGFFSVYVDEELNVKPCSFCTDNQYVFSLKETNFKDIWLKKFTYYRKKVANNCHEECNLSIECRGKCPYFEELFICKSL